MRLFLHTTKAGQPGISLLYLLRVTFTKWDGLSEVDDLLFCRELLDPSFLFAIDIGEKFAVQPMRFIALLKTTRVKVSINIDSVSGNELICFAGVFLLILLCPVAVGSTSNQVTSFSSIYRIFQICICFHFQRLRNKIPDWCALRSLDMFYLTDVVQYKWLVWHQPFLQKKKEWKNKEMENMLVI